MTPFTKEQIKQANSVNLIDFAKQNGYTLESGGNKAYHAKNSGGLYFFIDRNKYYHFGSNKGGGAIDFVMQFFNKNFTEAVEMLCGTSYERISPVKEKSKIEERRELILPEKAADFKRVYWYLVSVRGIDYEIVSKLMNEKKIYQQAEYGNCVFVGYDSTGNARYCSLRGTSPSKAFKMDRENSDKSYPFHIVGSSEKVYVCESPIDAMSHATLTKLHNEDWKKDHRISLGCISDGSLVRFLDKHTEIKKITFCLDNDVCGKLPDGTPCNFGQNAACNYAAKYKDLGYKVAIQKPNHKDFNEELIAFRNREVQAESVFCECER